MPAKFVDYTSKDTKLDVSGISNPELALQVFNNAREMYDKWQQYDRIDKEFNKIPEALKDTYRDQIENNRQLLNESDMKAKYLYNELFELMKPKYNESYNIEEQKKSEFVMPREVGSYSVPQHLQKDAKGFRNAAYDTMRPVRDVANIAGNLVINPKETIQKALYYGTGPSTPMVEKGIRENTLEDWSNAIRGERIRPVDTFPPITIKDAAYAKMLGRDISNHPAVHYGLIKENRDGSYRYKSRNEKDNFQEPPYQPLDSVRSIEPRSNNVLGNYSVKIGNIGDKEVHLIEDVWDIGLNEADEINSNTPYKDILYNLIHRKSVNDSTTHPVYNSPIGQLGRQLVNDYVAEPPMKFRMSNNIGIKDTSASRWLK